MTDIDYNAVGDELLKNNLLDTGGDKYDAAYQQMIEDQKMQVKASMGLALEKNPDEQANVVRLANKTSIPVGIVESNYKEVDKKARLEENDYDSILINNPALARMLENPYDAAIIHDDIPKISKVETAVNTIKGFIKSDKKIEELKKAKDAILDSTELTKDLHLSSSIGFEGQKQSYITAALALGVGMGEGGYSRDEYIKLIAESTRNSRDLRNKQPKYIKDFQEKELREYEDVTKANQQFMQGYDELKNKHYKDGLIDIAAGGIKSAGQFIDWAMLYPTHPKELAMVVTENLAQSSIIRTAATAGAITGGAIAAPTGIGIPAGVSIGAATFAFPATYGLEYGSSILEDISNKGYDITNEESLKEAFSNEKMMEEFRGRALRKGITIGSFESLFSLLAGKWIPKAQNAKQMANAAVKTVGASMAEESAGEYASQIAKEKSITKASFKEAALEGLTAWGSGLKEGFSQAMAQRSVNKMYNTERDKLDKNPVKAAKQAVEKANESIDAMNGALAVDQLVQAVKESKTTERIPEKVQEIIEGASEDIPTKIYFQTDEWDNYWNSKKISPQEAYHNIMGETKGYIESKEVGTQIEITLSKYATAMSKSEHHEQIMLDARLSPEAMSVREASEFNKNLPVLLNGLADESLKEDEIYTKEQDIESTPEYKLVYEDIYAKLRKAGRSNKEAKSVAKLDARIAAIRSKTRQQDIRDFSKEVDINNFEVPYESQGALEQAPPEMITERKNLISKTTETFQIHQEAKREREIAKNTLLNTLKTKIPEEQAVKLVSDLSSGKTRGMMYDAAQAIRNVAPDVDVESYMEANDKYFTTLASDNKARNKFNEFSDKNRTYFQVTIKTDINTKEFKEWFGDSKVVDKNGKPKIVYHGTNYDFDAFNYDKMGEKGTTMGRGFYFSENKNQSKGYGKNVIEAYINIQKPASLEERTITKQQIKELIESHKDTTDALSNYGDVNYEGYNKVLSAAIKSLDTLTNDVDIINSIGSDIYHNQWDQYFPIVKEKLGFDGTIVKDGKYTNYVVFNPNQIKSVYNNGSFSPSSDNIYYQTRQVVDTFYSKMIKTVEEKMGGSASVEQVNGMLKEIKPEERKWMQLDEFLKGKEKVSKEELLNFLNANQLHIEEKSSQPSDERITLQKEMNKIEKDIDKVTDKIVNKILSKNKKLDETDVRLAIINLGDPNYNEAARKYHTDYLTKNLKITEEEALKLAEPRYKKIEELSENINKQKNLRDSFRPIYEQYTLQGGENYREVKFKLPFETGFTLEINKEETEYQNDGKEYYDVLRPKSQGGGAIFTGTLSEANEYIKEETLRQGKEKGYTSGHFNREANILAFTRLKDRVDADGKKVLFIEEIQSDWHQEGRKKGYKEGKPEGLQVKEIKEAGRYFEIVDKNGTFVTNVIDDGSFGKLEVNANNAIKIAEKRVEQGKTGFKAGAVPDAPFKKTWHEFVLKRLIREAAEKGYDKIAWTTGEQQAERYDLSKQIGSVTYNSKTKTLRAYKPKESEMAYNGGLAFEKAGIEENSIEEYIGKDAAKKLLDSKQNKNGVKELDGLDLKTGGEGMKGFYDQMIPSFLNKFGKKYGAKVSETNIYSIKISGGYYADINTEGKNAVFFSDGSGSIPKEISTHNTKALAKEEASILNAALDMENKTKVHSLEITPSLKEAALYEGFTLFQKESDIARGQIRFGKNKINIDLFKKANFSTALHEFGHAWLENIKDDVEYISKIERSKLTDTQKGFLARADKILEWLEIGSWADLGRDQHEKWARGVEAYLMEGKAPTSTLRSIFDNFRVWLINIYKQLRGLNVELSDDIRNVMDRLIATEEEIAAEKGAIEVGGLFGDSQFLGMSEDKVKKYLKAKEEAELYVKEQVNNKLMKDYLRTKEKWYKEEKEKIKSEIDKDLNSRRVYKAIYLLQKGTNPDGSKLADGVEAIKLDKESIVKAYGKDFLKKLPRGIYSTKEGSLHHDVAASLLGYDNGDEMLIDISNTKNKDLLSKQMTDIEMQKQYPDIMNTNELPEEVIKQTHNDKRTEMLNMELEYLATHKPTVLKEGIRRIARKPPSSKKIKQDALKILGTKTIKEIRPIVFQRAEVKYRKEAGDLFTKGNIDGAFDAKLKELLNYELYSASIGIKDKLEKDAELFKKFNRKDEDLAKTRDMDLVNAGRAVLAQFGIGKMDKNPTEYLKDLEKYDTDSYNNMMQMYNELVKPVADKLAMKGNYEQISYDEYLSFVDMINSLWSLSKSVKETEIDQKKFVIDELAEQLKSQASDILGNKKTEYMTSASAWDQGVRSLMGTVAALTRVETWANVMDSGDMTGAFKKYVFNPVSKSVTNYKLSRTTYVKKHLELITKIADTFKDDKPIDAPELGEGVKLSSKADLVGALLHTGNDSNKSKLLRGWGWGSENEDGVLDTKNWDKFISRMISEKVLTKEHFDYVQSVWDMISELTPSLQKAHKKMYGHYFSEVTANEFTNEFGTYKGGYFPAKVDPFFSSEMSSREAKDLLENNNNSFSFPTTGRGATKKRVENYAAPLSLNVRLVNQHIDWALRFAHIEPSIKDTMRLLSNKDVKKTLESLDPTIYNDMLIPWLQRAAQQKVSFPSEGQAGKMLDKVARELRKRTGINAMFANVTNAMQQITGFSITSLKVSGRNLRNSIWQFSRSPSKLSKEIQEKSKYMVTRTDEVMNEATQLTEEILLNPSKAQEYAEFVKKHGYFMQTATQGFVDNVSWMAAYNDAIENRLSEQEAIDHADNVVRTTQGSQSAEDVSRFETGTPFQRLFTMFYSYFNMQANILGSEFVINYRNNGLRKGMGRALYIYTFGFMIPAVMSELIVAGMSGKGLDEDDDDQYLDDFMLLFFGSQFNTATAMIPFVGTAVKPVVYGFNSKPYDDKISTSPAVATLESAVSAPADIYKSVVQGNLNKKTVRDVLTLTALATGVPVGVLAKPIGYQMDVNEGKANPSNPIDYTRGLITGKSGK